MKLCIKLWQISTTTGCLAVASIGQLLVFHQSLTYHSICQHNNTSNRNLRLTMSYFRPPLKGFIRRQELIIIRQDNDHETRSPESSLFHHQKTPTYPTPSSRTHIYDIGAATALTPDGPFQEDFRYEDRYYNQEDHQSYYGQHNKQRPQHHPGRHDQQAERSDRRHDHWEKEGPRYDRRRYTDIVGPAMAISQTYDCWGNAQYSTKYRNQRQEAELEGTDEDGEPDRDSPHEDTKPYYRPVNQPTGVGRDRIHLGSSRRGGYASGICYTTNPEPRLQSTHLRLSHQNLERHDAVYETPPSHRKFAEYDGSRHNERQSPPWQYSSSLPRVSPRERQFYEDPQNPGVPLKPTRERHRAPRPGFSERSPSIVSSTCAEPKDSRSLPRSRHHSPHESPHYDRYGRSPRSSRFHTHSSAWYDVYEHSPRRDAFPGFKASEYDGQEFSPRSSDYYKRASAARSHHGSRSTRSSRRAPSEVPSVETVSGPYIVEETRPSRLLKAPQ